MCTIGTTFNLEVARNLSFKQCDLVEDTHFCEPVIEEGKKLDDAIDYDKNHSTYLRLARAEAILQNESSLNGALDVLTDQYYGQTELSICRSKEQDGEYHTQASVIFITTGKRTDCLYMINDKPTDETKYISWLDVFGDGEKSQGVAGDILR